MGKFIEPLESRQLFSTVPAVAVLNADAKKAVAALKALEATGHSNFLAIEAELKAAGEIKSSGSALSALASHATAATNALAKNVTKTQTLIQGDVTKFVAAAKRYVAKPTNAAAIKAKVATLAKLKADSSTRLTAINTAIENQASVDHIYAAQLITLNASDATLKSTLTAAGNKSAAGRTTLGNQAAKAWDTDAENVITTLLGA